jgi:hypothetical protein
VLPNLSGASFGAYAIWIWLVPLCALAAGGLAVWRAVSTQPNTATGLNRKNVAIAAAALGGVATLLLLIALFTAQGYCGAVLAPLASSIGSTSCGTVGGGFGITATISGGYGFSYWLLLLAAIGVGVGGIVQINTKP